MAKFTINFNAQYPGEHRIGYRDYTYPVDTYDFVEVSVAVPGPQSVEIDVPHNLYCATLGVTYNCYAVAFCQNNGYTPVGPGGAPNGADLFDVVVAQQTDPCNIVTVTCDAVPITNAVIATPGSGYTPGTYELDIVTGDEVTPAVIEVVVDGGGTVTSIALIDGGLFGVIEPTFEMPPAAGAGTNATFTITMGVSTLDLETLTYTNFTAYDSLGSTIDLNVGDTLVIAADPTEAAVVDATDEFSVVTPVGNDKNCHCQGCRTVTIDVTGAVSGEGKIIYNQCWDITTPNNSKMITRKILPGQTWDLGCVDPSTVNVIQGTLDVAPVVTEVVCP